MGRTTDLSVTHICETKVLEIGQYSRLYPKQTHQINLGKQNKIYSLLDNLSSFRSRHTTKSTNTFFFSTKHRPAMHELLQQYYLESLGKPKIGCKEKHQKSLYLYEINQFLTAKINARGQFSSISN